mgnify:FL=1
MANRVNLINPGETVLGRTDYREGFSLRVRLLLVIVALIAFFFLPKFLTLHVRGLSLWSSLIGGVFVAWAMHREKSVMYAVTHQALYKVVGAHSRAWRIPLDEISEMRTHKKWIILCIPKKTYLLYNNPGTQKLRDLIQTLRIDSKLIT